MARLNFPLNPTINDVYVKDGEKWIYNGVGWITNNYIEIPEPTTQEIIDGTELNIRSWSPYTIFQAISNYLNNNKPTQVFYPSSFYDDKPEPDQTMLFIVFVGNDVTFPINFTGSQGYVKVAPADTTVFKIQKNEIDIGTMTFSSGIQSATFSLSEQTVFTPGDRLSIIAPTMQDIDIYGLAITLAGVRNS